MNKFIEMFISALLGAYVGGVITFVGNHTIKIMTGFWAIMIMFIFVYVLGVAIDWVDRHTIRK